MERQRIGPRIAVRAARAIKTHTSPDVGMFFNAQQQQKNSYRKSLSKSAISSHYFI